MPTPHERRALIFLAALGALGVGIRAIRGAHAEPARARDSAESRAALDRQLNAVDSAVGAKRGAGGRGRTRRGGARDTGGADGSRPAQAKSAPSGRTQAVAPGAPVAPDPLALYEARRLDVVRSNREAQERIDRDFGAARVSPPPAATAPAIGSSAGVADRRTPVDLDTAGADAIAALPWVGPTLAARIVADRTARGPFGSLAGLERVRGVGPGLIAKIGQLVVFSRVGSGAEKVVKFRATRVHPKRP